VLVHLCAVNKERMQNRFDRAAYRTSLCVLFLESNIHAFFSLSLSAFPSLPLVSLKHSWCTVAKENNHDVNRALCKIDFKTGGW